MKAKLEFDLNDVDDRQAHMRAVKATQAYLAHLGMKAFLFKIIERIDSQEIPVKEEDRRAIENIIEEYESILYYHNIDLDSELS